MKAKAKRRPNMHGKPVQAKTVKINITQSDIDSAECRNPNKCMIKVAVKRALNMAHGYIHVDASGISISRNGAYREKSAIPRTALVRMLAFDQELGVKPFHFTANFKKTTKVRQLSEETKKNDVIRAKKNGSAKKRYNMRSRVIGIAVSGGAQLQEAA